MKIKEEKKKNTFFNLISIYLKIKVHKKHNLNESHVNKIEWNTLTKIIFVLIILIEFYIPKMDFLIYF